MRPYEIIEGYEQVIDTFGCWPSFHDGEVHRIVLDRMSRTAAGTFIPTLELHLRGWIMTRDDEVSSFEFHNDSIVRILFEDVFDVDLQGFNHQNVLSSLNLALFEDAERQVLHVELEHCYVFSGEFRARKARVLGIDPYRIDA